MFQSLLTPSPSLSKVLAALRYCYAFEAAMHPQIRAHFREEVRHYAVINVRPTRQGFAEIADSDELAKYKFITNKPMCVGTREGGKGRER